MLTRKLRQRQREVRFSTCIIRSSLVSYLQLHRQKLVDIRPAYFSRSILLFLLVKKQEKIKRSLSVLGYREIWGEAA